ncbi:LysM peptidoglycan-binding domain-containing protein [Mastigocoleus sp. MO_188.B34]|uniref:LysM peptidoglycan-binding domain-containing protein n=1 Tax=Mastigocoleus sp. MO_188.B34 TaxID=3036635 RepID=UPI00261B8977|nr:LysM peptidoglycan-binding domain-containing protein [Mastigocoleus sp. MO_188.B34]MDJ0695826.1 LysM peptidoglycan-binding domain-containing protein [Mastigocoleus sp. MO_188.B34]
MSCTCGTSYIIKSGDTLFLIAERELGDGNRWQEITKPNCTPFTEEEARKLYPGDEICLPSKGSIIKFAGVRSSPYFYYPGPPEPFPPSEYWAKAMQTMAGYFPSSTPVGVWLVGEFNDTKNTNSGMNMGFPNPGGNYDPRIRFSDIDKHESYLSYFDRQGVKVFLQVESGYADMKDLIDVTLRQYGHHPSVIGFGIDVEWYKRTSVALEEADKIPPVTDELAQVWEEAVKSYNPSYRLCLKHYHRPSWDDFKLPKNYRGEIIFINSAQGFSSYQAFLNWMTEFADYFSTNPVMFQIGYDDVKNDETGKTDKFWWEQLTQPFPQTIGLGLAEKCSNPEVGVIWVDFTLKDIVP